MNPLILLMGLLALAYMGSLLSGERRLRGFGLPSGLEYVALGLVVGPKALGWLDHSILEPFDPIAEIALGWITFVLGLSFGVSTRERPHFGLKNLALASLASLVTLAIIGGALLFTLTRFTTLGGQDRLLLSLAVAIACSETTRESVRWVTERYSASGPVSSAVKSLAEGDDIIPLVALAVCFSISTKFSPVVHVPWHSLPAACAAWALITIGMGIVFGILAALMIGREIDVDETWGTLVGFGILATGLMTRMGLSPMSAMFAMGFSLALFSTHRKTLLTMVEPTERSVLHPMLLLAGARIVFHAEGLPLGLLVFVTIAARVLAKALIAGTWQGLSRKARRAGPLFGLGMLSSGTLSMTVGLACALRFPGAIGDTVLATAAAATALGELLGPYALRASLTAAGEIEEVPKSADRGSEQA